MSRSYKKNPCYSMRIKGMKTIASRNIRRKLKNVNIDAGSYSFYKKMYQSYNICEYRSRMYNKEYYMRNEARLKIYNGIDNDWYYAYTCNHYKKLYIRK